MTTQEFRKQVKAMGLEIRKQRGLEMFDVIHEGTEICSVTFAELHFIASASDILEKKMRTEYLPPLG